MSRTQQDRGHRQPDTEHVITRGDPRQPDVDHDELDVFKDPRTARHHVQAAAGLRYLPDHGHPRVVGEDPAVGLLVYVTEREVSDDA